jgi:hypothetical protein
MEIALSLAAIIVASTLLAMIISWFAYRGRGPDTLYERMLEHALGCHRCKVYRNGGLRLSDRCATGAALRAERHQVIEQRQEARLAHDAMRARSAR